MLDDLQELYDNGWDASLIIMVKYGIFPTLFRYCSGDKEYQVSSFIDLI